MEENEGFSPTQLKEQGHLGAEKNWKQEAKEKKEPEELLSGIIQKVEKYVVEGRPGLEGQHEIGHRFKGKRDNEPGSRGGLCSLTSQYVNEVVVTLQKEHPELNSRVYQAELLYVPLSAKLDMSDLPIFRRHGFNIIINEETREWWIVDTTLNQFVKKEDNNEVKFVNSGIVVKEEGDFYPSVVASKLMDDGYVDGSSENLAAFITLMVDIGYKENFYEDLLEKIKKGENLKIILQRMYPEQNIEENTVRDWGPSVEKLFS